MTRAKKLFINTLVMTGAQIAARSIGLALTAYITGRIGSAGMGLYGLIMSVYLLAVTLGSAGVRTAATRLVIYEQAKNTLCYRAVIRRCVIYSLAMGTFACLLAATLAGPVSSGIIGDARAAAPLRLLAASLPFVAMTNALSGALIAQGRSAALSFIQISELAIRLGCCAAGFFFFIGRGTQAALCVVAAATAISEATSFIIALLVCHLQNRAYTGATYDTLRRFSRIAAPEAFGAWVRQALVTAEHLLIPIGLRKFGAGSDAALAGYGLVSQIAFPVLLFPSCLLSSLSLLLIPEISLSHTTGAAGRVGYMSTKSVRIALIFSLLCAAVFYFFASPLTFAIYKSDAAAVYLRAFAPLVPVMFLDMTTDGILKGLDRQVDVMKYNIADALFSVALVALLVPKMGVDGYIVTVCAAELLNFGLSFSRLASLTPIRLSPLRDVAGPLVLCAAAGAAASYITRGAPFIAGVALCVTLGLMLMRLTGCIGRDDTGWLRRTLKK